VKVLQAMIDQTMAGVTEPPLVNAFGQPLRGSK
jgi:hypothetical protein